MDRPAGAGRDPARQLRGAGSHLRDASALVRQRLWQDHRGLRRRRRAAPGDAREPAPRRRLHQDLRHRRHVGRGRLDALRVLPRGARGDRRGGRAGRHLRRRARDRRRGADGSGRGGGAHDRARLAGRRRADPAAARSRRLGREHARHPLLAGGCDRGRARAGRRARRDLRARRAAHAPRARVGRPPRARHRPRAWRHGVRDPDGDPLRRLAAGRAAGGDDPGRRGDPRRRSHRQPRARQAGRPDRAAREPARGSRAPSIASSSSCSAAGRCSDRRGVDLPDHRRQRARRSNLTRHLLSSRPGCEVVVVDRERPGGDRRPLPRRAPRPARARAREHHRPRRARCDRSCAHRRRDPRRDGRPRAGVGGREPARLRRHEHRGHRQRARVGSHAPVAPALRLHQHRWGVRRGVAREQRVAAVGGRPARAARALRDLEVRIRAARAPVRGAVRVRPPHGQAERRLRAARATDGEPHDHVARLHARACGGRGPAAPRHATGRSTRPAITSAPRTSPAGSRCSRRPALRRTSPTTSPTAS